MRTFYSGCKLNLGLRVLNKRPDGKHNLESVFLPLWYPQDILVIKPASNSKFSLRCSHAIEGKNILNKTWEIFCDVASIQIGVDVNLVKQIPMGAGLGGGSANAACLLGWLNQFSRIPPAELLDIASAIGADVPFFLHNKLALVTGAGENIRILPEIDQPFWVVLVWPEISINTGWAFGALDKLRSNPEFLLTNHKNTDTGFFSIQGELEIFANDLEQPVFAQYPILDQIRQDLLNRGANYAAMSGSGSTIYGLFFDRQQASQAFAKLHENYRSVFFVSGNTGRNMAPEHFTGM